MLELLLWLMGIGELELRPAPRPDPQVRLQRYAEAPARSTVDWDALAECESNQRWNYNGPSGYDGGLQFHPRTWSAYRSEDHPQAAWQATREQQIEVAERVLEAQGLGAWPACTRKLGWR